MSSAREAVILAAGQGKRLQDWRHPKSLLPVGPTTFIQRSINQLQNAGIDKIHVVVGYKKHELDFLTESAPSVSLVENIRFAEAGSFESLRLGTQKTTGDFLLLDGDIVYSSRALDAALKHGHGSGLVVTGASGSGDEVWATSSQGYVTYLGKRPPRDENPENEHAGISIVRTSLRQEILSAESRHSGSEYESFFNLVCASIKISEIYVPDLVWSEVDNLEDLKRMSEFILPALEEG